MRTAAGFDIGRMTKIVEETRKDVVSIDFARLICANFAKMVEHFSSVEGRPVSGHNNKTLFLEAIDIWCRKKIGCSGQDASMNGASMGRAQGSWTDDPKTVVRSVMGPWYEAMDLEDPSRYRMRPQQPCPAYMGRHEDATAYMMGLCACLEVGPLWLVFGKNGDEVQHVWSRVQADNKIYNSDLSNPDFKLGDHYEFEKYEEVEIPL